MRREDSNERRFDRSRSCRQGLCASFGTSFVDFVSKSGTPKLTVVRRTKKLTDDGYGPEKDFYKRIREAIIEMHPTGGSITRVSGVLPGLTDKKKIDSYPKLVDGYKRWTGRRGAEWFEPPSVLWSCGGLSVRVNPELGLIIKGRPHLTKLYFKTDSLAKNRIDIITHLMRSACSSKAPTGCVMGVLDIRRPKLFTPTVPIDGLDSLLRGEAASWATVWKDLGE